jgi:uncharacterized protein
LRELVRHVGGTVGAVQRELELLTACGLVRREVRGKQVYFQVNHDATIFPELRGLFAKTSGLVDILCEALMPLADRIVEAFVFGCAARGELHAASDIDLMVIGDPSFGDVTALIRDTEKRLGRDVNPTVYSVDAFRGKVNAKYHFLTTVIAGPKLFVLGDGDGLHSVSKKRRREQASGRSKQPRTSQPESHRAHRD